MKGLLSQGVGFTIFRPRNKGEIDRYKRRRDLPDISNDTEDFLDLEFVFDSSDERLTVGAEPELGDVHLRPLVVPRSLIYKSVKRL